MIKFATALFFLLCSLSHSSEPITPQIICDKVSLADEEIEISVVGLSPHQVIRMEASWLDSDHVEWSSWAEFQADEKGVVDLSCQTPLKGSYEGIDSMGLFWSMEMGHVVILENHRDVPLDDYCDNAFIIHLTVSDDNDEIAEKGLCRLIGSPETEVIELRENGLVGDLFIPPSEEALPVVIVLSGSNGGIPSGHASLFAANGIAAFALAYSGADDLPPIVKNVPLEYFERAFEWVKNHPRLNGKIYLYGASRGAELALLLGSMFPDAIERIVASAPSSVVLSSDSWTYKGKPVLPAAPYFVDYNYDYQSDFSTRDKARSIRIHRERGFFLENERFEAASIPVEKINCPILLISGGDDQLGPASFYARMILARLDKHRSQIQRIHLDYPEAGHFISIPYYPRENVFCDEGGWETVGGTPLADELASRDSWMKILQFLQE